MDKIEKTDFFLPTNDVTIYSLSLFDTNNGKWIIGTNLTKHTGGINHWAIKCLMEMKILIERYNKELPSETSKCSNHVYNEIQASLIKNGITNG